MSHSSFPEQQDQQYQYQFQYEQQPQTLDSSQYQTSDPQSFYNYSYAQPDPNAQQNPYYTPEYYAQYQPQNPPSLHPPGVSPAPELSSYFPIPSLEPPQMAPFSENFPIGQTPYRGGGRGGARPSKRGRGHFGNFPSSSRGRGRSRGGGGHSGSAPPQQRPLPAPAPPPPQPSSLAFCDLCRVYCNSQKLLQNHFNGKRHLKNLQLSEGLQKPDKEPEIPQTPLEPKESSEILTNGISNGAAQVPVDVAMENVKPSKFIKGNEGSKIPVPPLLCEICNVKCDTQTVLNIHMSGKRHQSNLNRARSAGAKPSFPATPIAPENFDEFQIVLAQLLMKCVHSQAQAPGLSVEALNGLTQLRQMDQNALPAEMRVQIETLIAMCSPAAPAQGTINGPANGVLEISNEAAIKADVDEPIDDSSVIQGENSEVQEQSKVEITEAVQTEEPKNEEPAQ